MANRVLLGKKGSTYGLYISKPGKDVTTASGQDLIFKSDNPEGTSDQGGVGSIITLGGSGALHSIHSITISSGSTSGTSAISGLAYVPFVSWAEYDGNEMLGQRFNCSKSIGGGSAPSGSGEHAMAGGKSSSAFSHWYCKVTNSQIEIGSWIDGTHYYSGEYYNTAGTLLFPYDNIGGDGPPYGSNGQVTSTRYFKVFVYRIPAATE